MAMVVIESGLAEDNKDVELNCLLFECNKMLSDMWQQQEPIIEFKPKFKRWLYYSWILDNVN
eukprot:13017992-Ditylum_brightwellii.AAC.2